MKSKEGTKFARFEVDRYYRPGDPALDTIASRGTLATWRWAGRGPRYVKFGHRVLYRGSDLNAWLDECVVQPTASPRAKAASRPSAAE